MMMRIVQGLAIWIAVVLVAAVVALLANTGREPAVCDAELALSSAGCFLREYKELEAGVLGTGGAIFAAWIAWLAIQRQLRHDEELATAHERANLKAILLEMKDLFETLNEIWRAIDIALLPEQTEQQRRHRIAVAKATMMTLPAELQLAELQTLTDALAKEINPLKRGQYIRVWQAINWIYRAREEKEIAPDNDDGRFQLSMIRIHLSHLDRYILAFDPETGGVFDGRTKENVDHRGMAAQIKPVVDKAATGKPL
jgi:hypothetical protein